MRLLFLLPMLAACSTPGPAMIAPAVVVEKYGVIVRADDREAAQRVVETFSDLDKRVRSLLDVGSAPTPQLWLLDVERLGVADAAVSYCPPVIGLARGHHGSHQLLAHELVHGYVRVWPAELPTVVEDGLADLVAGEAIGRLPEMRQAHARVLAGMDAFDVRAALRVSLEEFLRITDRDVSTRLRAIGFTVANHFGLDGLRALCTRAKACELKRVPVEWLAPGVPALAPAPSVQTCVRQPLTPSLV